MRCNVVVGTEYGADLAKQLLLHLFRLTDAAACERVLFKQELSAHDLVNPILTDLQPPQLIGNFNSVPSKPKEGRRALEHGDMRAGLHNVGNQGRSGRARPNDNHLLALERKIVRPGLRVNDPPPKILHAVPFGHEAFRMPIVTLAHPQEVRGHGNRLCAVDLFGFDGPEVLPARPVRAQNPVPVANMSCEIVVLDHLAHIAQNFLSACDRRTDPRLEAIAEGVEVTVGANTGIAMRPPGSAKTLLDHKARSGKLRRQVIGAATPEIPAPTIRTSKCSVACGRDAETKREVAMFIVGFVCWAISVG